MKILIIKKILTMKKLKVKLNVIFVISFILLMIMIYYEMICVVEVVIFFK
jgi:hypothetical protein